MALANEAWKNKEYEKCQSIFAKIVTEHGSNAMAEWGPKFGNIYYSKGVCELGLAQIAKRAKDDAGFKKWSLEASKSLQACYKDFPNDAESKKKSTNTRHKMSLQRWAEAQMNLENYDEAAKLYGQFLAERGARDQFYPTPGGFYVSIANANFKLSTPNLEDGMKYLEKAISDQGNMETSESFFKRGFLAMSDAVIETENEKVMLDFLERNRSSIILSPYRMYERTPLFLKLAADAINAEMYTAALKLYSFVPSTENVIQDTKAKMAQFPNRDGVIGNDFIVKKSELEKNLAEIQAKVKSNDPVEVSVLISMSFLNQMAGNNNGVYAALKLLEEKYPKSKKRESNLFNLIRVAPLVGRSAESAAYAEKFMNDFPESEKISQVREILLTGLFFKGEYEASLAIANSTIGLVTKPSKQHDICLFIQAGSNYYLGKDEIAQPLLDNHVEEYPESDFIMSSLYFQASNALRQQDYAKATQRLNAFIEKYPNAAENSYLPNALYDLAKSYYSDGLYEEAIEKLSRIETEFAGANIIDLVYNLKGNVSEALENYEAAEAAYLMALEKAEAKGRTNVASEALNYLIGMLSQKELGGKENTRIKEAVPYYDRFMKQYSDSLYKPQVAVYGLSAMNSVGRGDEGLENLKKVIGEAANTKSQFFLEDSVNAYTDTFLSIEGNTADKLKDVYDKMPGIGLSNKRAIALLRIAVIGAYEKALKEAVAANDDKLKLRYESGIKSLFKDLKNTFNPNELSDSIVLRIGDYLREKTNSPAEALPYYEALLKSRSKENQNLARLGMADIKGESDDPAEIKKAISILEEVYSKLDGDKVTEGKVLSRLVELTAKVSNWPECEKYARLYLKGKHTKKAAEVSYLFALSFDKRGMKDDALANYGSVYSRYMGYIKISAPSVKRVLEIMWARNKKAGEKVGKVILTKDDRQSAYEEIGFRFIESTTKIRKTNEDMTEEEKQLWDEVDALVKKYENSGQVITMKKIRAEAAKPRR
ncbi:MAG: tetratricopeptide repeat protein [Akkermansiaceae bacterium]